MGQGFTYKEIIMELETNILIHLSKESKTSKKIEKKFKKKTFANTKFRFYENLLVKLLWNFKTATRKAAQFAKKIARKILHKIYIF